MNKELFLIGRVPNERQYDLAKVVSLGTKTGTMLPKSYDSVLDLFKKEHSFVTFNDREPIGHAALTFEWDDGWFELGGVYTDPEYFHQGIALGTVLGLLDHTRKKYPDGKFFALANEKSSGLFAKMGGRVMSNDELPGTVWSACETCPIKPENLKGDITMCCDTPYDLTNAKRSMTNGAAYIRVSPSQIYPNPYGIGR